MVMLKECKKQEWSKQYVPGNPLQRGQREDQRYAGREDDVKKVIHRLKVPNWKAIVQDRRWKEMVGKVKTVR